MGGEDRVRLDLNRSEQPLDFIASRRGVVVVVDDDLKYIWFLWLLVIAHNESVEMGREEEEKERVERRSKESAFSSQAPFSCLHACTLSRPRRSRGITTVFFTRYPYMTLSAISAKWNGGGGGRDRYPQGCVRHLCVVRELVPICAKCVEELSRELTNRGIFDGCRSRMFFFLVKLDTWTDRTKSWANSDRGKGYLDNERYSYTRWVLHIYLNPTLSFK